MYHFSPILYIGYLKIADLQAHNASHHNALWACRSAIFKHFITFTFGTLSTIWCQYFCTFTQVNSEFWSFTCNRVFLYCGIDRLLLLLLKKNIRVFPPLNMCSCKIRHWWANSQYSKSDLTLSWYGECQEKWPCHWPPVVLDMRRWKVHWICSIYIHVSYLASDCQPNKSLVSLQFHLVVGYSK